MSERRKRYSGEFKKSAVERMAGCPNVTALAAELGIRRKFLYQWRDQMREGGEAALARGPGKPSGAKGERAAAREGSAEKARIAELERLLGRKQLEVDFFKQAFEHVREAPASNTNSGARGSITPSARGIRSKED
jgi:transposase-like protein